MGLTLVILLVVFGVGTLFITPWVGAGLLMLAVVAGLVIVVGSMMGERTQVRDAPVDTGLPGPGNPRSGVDTGTREL